MLISLVVPCYNEEECIENFYKETCEVCQQIKDAEFEIIFVDDGSKDKTLKIMKSLQQQDSKVEYISFSRNFGKEAAMLAGMEMAKGDFVAVMDVDLQDPPSLLLEMYQTLSEKDTIYDCVATRRVTRKGEPLIRSFFARTFYKLINKISDTQIVDGARDFRLMTRQMVNAILEVTEYNRFSKGIFQWVGFETKWIEYVNVERKSGNTKWSFFKLFIYSLEGILAFSTVPLSLASILGGLLSIIAFIVGIQIFIQKIFIGIDIPGYATQTILMLLIGGIQLLSIGIVGQYLAKTYLEVKNRPKYVVKATSVKKEK